MYTLLLIIATLIKFTYSTPCCVIHTDESTCAAEAGTAEACIWLEDDDPLLVTSAGIQCVSAKWVECEENGICPPPPPVKPNPECVFETCTNNGESFNVAFVIDESGSVGYTNYLISLDFVENMVENDINEVSAISIISFGSGTDRIYHFTDSQDDQKAGALAALDEERSDYRGGMTCTACGLNLALDDYAVANISAEENNILFLLTDGYPNTGGSVCDYKDDLDAAGIEVYIVGISSGFSSTAVECLVDDTDNNILSIPSFKASLFYRLESQLRNVVCPVVYKDHILAAISNPFYDLGYHYGSFMFWFVLVIFLLTGLVYYNREKICRRNGKYQLLIEKKVEQYV